MFSLIEKPSKGGFCRVLRNEFSWKINNKFKFKQMKYTFFFNLCPIWKSFMTNKKWGYKN